jgi:CheY-like chemotaxis protein
MTQRELPRILVVDNDERVRTSLQTILEREGYRVRVTQDNKDILEQSKTIACEFRPHVAVVDLRLLDDYNDERSGLELLNNLQSAECILYSAYLSPEVIREAIRKYGASDWVNKHESPRSLLVAIEEAAAKNYVNWPDEAIHWPTKWSRTRIIQTLFGLKNDVPIGLVEDVLGQLFAQNEAMDLQTVGGVVITSPPISRGRSVVLKVQPEGLEPVILKLASSDRLQREQKNYFEYVKDRLVGRFYPLLERKTSFWDLGGIVYSFIGTSLNTVPSFTVFYEQSADVQAILRPLHHFFTEVWSRHYQQPLSEEETSLFQIYDDALRLRRRLESFEDRSETIAFPGVPVPLTNPVPWLLQHAHRSVFPGVRQTITHGDLHGDNLFVDSEHAWVIDFERTGPSHILQDFVELEIDIVTRLAPLPTDNMQLLYDLAQALTASFDLAVDIQRDPHLQINPVIHKVLHIVGGLRRIAVEATGVTDIREYLWGLLFDAVFVAALASRETPQRDRALLYGAVLCERLEKWYRNGEQNR